jgi:hypothetical protein
MAWQLGGYLRAQLLFQLYPSTPARPSRVACLFVIDRPRGCALMPRSACLCWWWDGCMVPEDPLRLVQDKTLASRHPVGLASCIIRSVW